MTLSRTQLLLAFLQLGQVATFKKMLMLSFTARAVWLEEVLACQAHDGLLHLDCGHHLGLLQQHEEGCQEGGEVAARALEVPVNCMICSYLSSVSDFIIPGEFGNTYLQ